MTFLLLLMLCLQDSHKLDLFFSPICTAPQVGRFEVNLISPDTKSVVLEKNFKDISSCSQVSINKKPHVDHQEKRNLFVLQLGSVLFSFIQSQMPFLNSFSYLNYPE